MKMHVSLDFTAEADTLSEMMEQAYEAIGVLNDLPFTGHVGFYVADVDETRTHVEKMEASGASS